MHPTDKLTEQLKRPNRHDTNNLSTGFHIATASSSSWALLMSPESRLMHDKTIISDEWTTIITPINGRCLHGFKNTKSSPDSCSLHRSIWVMNPSPSVVIPCHWPTEASLSQPSLRFRLPPTVEACSSSRMPRSRRLLVPPGELD